MCLHYAWRDYGNRVGIWRMMAAMDRYGVRGSISLNVAVCDHFPDIAAACRERGWEFFSHGVYNTRYTYNMSEDQERAFIEDVKASIRKWSGQELAGLARAGVDADRAHHGPAGRGRHHLHARSLPR